MDAELEFAIQPSTTGKQLFDQVRSLNNMLNLTRLAACLPLDNALCNNYLQMRVQFHKKRA